MTPKEAYLSGGRHPKTGWRVGDWYGFVCTFFPKVLAHEGNELHGCRAIHAMDMASGFAMEFDAVPEEPTTIRSSRLIPFIERVFEVRGKPRKGLVVSHSCWLSSLELSLDEDTAMQGLALEEMGIEFGPMPDTDKDEIRKWALAHGVELFFDADQVPMGYSPMP